MKKLALIVTIASMATLSAQSDTHEKVQLWEGGPYWATTNIGADKPEDYGLYFWWGDTTGHRPSMDGIFSFQFSQANSDIYTYGKVMSQLQNAGWLTNDGVLVPAHDAAHVQWGGGWRMPTRQELVDLTTNCDWISTTMNGVNGFIVRGRDAYAFNSIFLPAAGFAIGSSLSFPDLFGRFWSSVTSVTYSNSSSAYFSGFDWSGYGTTSDGRCYGYSVRPVYEFGEETIGLLTAESADWSSGSITLRCEDSDTSGTAHEYTLEYKNSSGEWEEVDGAKNVAANKGQDANGQEVWVAKLTDAAFWSRLGGLPPVEYSVKDENGRVSEGCVTRNRHGLFVGINEYRYSNNLSGCVADAQNISEVFAMYGDCRDNRFLLNSKATKQNIIDALNLLSGQIQSGDILLFYFSGHGAEGGYLVCHDSDKRAESCIASTELAALFANFSCGIGLVCVLDSCFSAGMIPQSDFGKGFGQKVSQCMNNLCGTDAQRKLSGDEVGWITSSQANETSKDNNGIGKFCIFGHPFIAPFGEWVAGGLFTTECLCYRGWLKGRADGIGLEVADGHVTFGELAIWGQHWMGQNYDCYKRMSDYRHFPVLDHIVAGRVPESGELALLSSPSAISAERGSDGELKVSWSAVSGAKAYNVFRSAKGSSVTNFIAVVSGLSHIDGKEIALDPNLEYEYYVRAENEDDISDASSVVSGTVAKNEQLHDFVMQHMTDATVASLSTTEHLPVENGSVVYSNLNYDHDGDGYTTFQEYVAGTDPANRMSCLISKIVLTNEVPVVTWVPDLGNARKYKIYGKAELSDAEWQEVPPEGNPAHRFFKVGVEMP